MPFRTLDDLDLAGKRVLVRVDINVPVRDGRVTDATRMEAIGPTMREIVDKGGVPVLLAHFGRPKGKREPGDVARAARAARSAQVLGLPVAFAADCVGAEAKTVVETLPHGAVAAAREPPLPRRRRRRTIRSSQTSWRASATSTSTTPSRRRTGRTPRPRAWPTCCPRPPGG